MKIADRLFASLLTRLTLLRATRHSDLAADLAAAHGSDLAGVLADIDRLRCLLEIRVERVRAFVEDYSTDVPNLAQAEHLAMSLEAAADEWHEIRHGGAGALVGSVSKRECAEVDAAEKLRDQEIERYLVWALKLSGLPAKNKPSHEALRTTIAHNHALLLTAHDELVKKSAQQLSEIKGAGYHVKAPVAYGDIAQALDKTTQEMADAVAEAVSGSFERVRDVVWHHHAAGDGVVGQAHEVAPAYFDDETETLPASELAELKQHAVDLERWVGLLRDGLERVLRALFGQEAATSAIDDLGTEGFEAVMQQVRETATEARGADKTARKILHDQLRGVASSLRHGQHEQALDLVEEVISSVRF